MRLLAVTNCFPRSFTDTRAPWNRQQFLALGQHHRIRLIVPVPFTQSQTSRQPSELRWSQSADIVAHYPRFWFTPRCLQHHYGAFMLRSIHETVERVLSNFAPDVVMGCWAHPDGYAAVETARRCGVPSLIKVVGSDILVLARDRKRRACIAEVLSRADGVFAVSRDLARKVTELGVAPEKVHIIPEGINRTLFTPGNKAQARNRLGLELHRPMLLFVGNLLESKGVAVLLQACRIMADRNVDFRCHLIGAGRDEVVLRRQSAALRLEGTVAFEGALPHNRLPDWYRASDVVTLPSYSEGIPNCLREALCCGRPFVATRVGGIPEISPDSCTTLVPPANPGALADALEQMLRKPPSVDSPATDSICCSWEESAAKVNRVLLDLTARRNKPSPDVTPAFEFQGERQFIQQP